MISPRPLLKQPTTNCLSHCSTIIQAFLKAKHLLPLIVPRLLDHSQEATTSCRSLSPDHSITLQKPLRETYIMFSFLKQMIPFKPALPTPADLTRKALKACRRTITIQQGWGVQLRDLRASEIPEELSFDRIVFPQPGKEVYSVGPSFHI